MPKKYSLAGLDVREHAILMCIFQIQLDDPKGISWEKLYELEPISNEMARLTFSRKLKGLIEKGLVEQDVIKNKRGNPTLIRLNSKLLADLKEFREMFLPWNLENKIKEFEKRIEPLDTQSYTEAQMELTTCLLDFLIIALMLLEKEGTKNFFYEATYSNIENIFKSILDRASRSKEDKEKTLRKLFELLDVLSTRPIGKHFELDEVSYYKEEIIRTVKERD